MPENENKPEEILKTSDGAQADNSAMPRRRRVGQGDGHGSEPAAPTAEAPAVKPQPAVSPAPESQSGKTAKAGAAAGAAAETADVAAAEAKRKRLLLLVAAVVIAGWIMAMILISGNGGGAGAGESGKSLNPEPAPKHDFTKGNEQAKLAGKLIDAGDYAKVTAKSSAVRKEFEDNIAILKATYRAETVQAVVELGKKLDAMTAPEPKSDAVTAAENLRRLEQRLPVLELLSRHRGDWGAELTSVSAAKKVYAQYDAEIENAPAAYQRWKAGLQLLLDARKAVESDQSDLARAAEKLHDASTRLPQPEIALAAGEVSSVVNAEQALSSKSLAAAVRALDAAKSLEGVKAPEAGKETTIARAVRLEVLEHYRGMRRTLGAWGDLNGALERSSLDHADGKTAAALKLIDAALPKADPTNPLTLELIDQLKDRRKHYAEVLEAWDKAQATKKSGSVADELRGWTTFQGVLRKSDDFYSSALRNELKEVKTSLQKNIAEHYALLEKAGAGYRPISATMRKPESPREPFAAQAALLTGMATEADKIRELAALVPNWNLGEETSGQVDYAKSVLGDHNDQARRLWNLMQLYRNRGLLKEARECMERVMLLGNLSSNPWYAEADKLLKEKE